MEKSFQERIQELANRIIDDGYNSICFWMPCYNVSGGARYLRDLAIALADNTKLKIYYVDFENGFPSSLLNDISNVEIVSFNPNDIEFPIKEPTIICTNSTKVIQIKKMHPKSKLLFWHFETIPCAWDWLFFNNEEHKFIQLAKDKHAMIYHDWSGRDILSHQFNIDFDNKDYLHVYSLLNADITQRKSFNEKEINVVWLSRLGAEKVCSLYNIIDNLVKYKTNKIKRLHIIGDGIRRENVENYCKKFKDKLEIIFTGTIPYSNLGRYLLDNADLVFAMGTSVIECAALKIPSVVVQLSSAKFSDDAYYWLFDAKEYCVGITTDQKKRYNVPYKKMEDLLKAIDSEEKFKAIGEKCYDYYLKYHNNFDEIIEDFLRFSLNTTLTYRQLKRKIKFTPYNIIEQTDYSIKGHKFYARIKFGNRVFIQFFGLTILNYKLNDKLRYVKWGLGKCLPIIPKIFRTQYVAPNNESIEERFIKIGNKKLIKVNKNKKQTKYILLNKWNVLLKRENIGYTFPQSLFRG